MPKKREGRPEWFKAHRHLRAIIDAVPSEAAGDAIKAAFAYFDGDEPQELDSLATVVFSALRASIDEAWSSYQRSVENGSKGGRPLVSKGNPPLPTPTEEDKEEQNIDSETYRDIVEYLNQKADTKFKHTTTKTRSCINARLHEGFALEDFKLVIDAKCADWLGDQKMEKFLRPETLFGTKFEGYLNDARRHAPNQQQKFDLAPLEDPYEAAMKEGYHD